MTIRQFKMGLHPSYVVYKGPNCFPVKYLNCSYTNGEQGDLYSIDIMGNPDDPNDDYAYIVLGDCSDDSDDMRELPIKYKMPEMLEELLTASDIIVDCAYEAQKNELSFDEFFDYTVKCINVDSAFEEFNWGF